MNIFSALTAGDMAVLFLGLALVCVIPVLVVYRYQSCGRKLWNCREEIQAMLKDTGFRLKIICNHSWAGTDYTLDRYGVFTHYDIQHDGLNYGLSTVKFLKYIRKVKAGKMTLTELRLKCVACATAHNKSEAKINSL